jgi:hypothetical protein
MSQSSTNSSLPAQLRVRPERYDFGSVAIGDVSRAEIRLKHLGSDSDDTIEIKATPINGDPAFRSSFKESRPLKPGKETSLTVYFEPKDASDSKATLSVEHTGSDDTLRVDLLGKSTLPDRPSTAETTEAAGPTIINTSPQDNDTDVARGAGVEVTFSDGMKWDTVKNAFTLRNEDTSTPVPAQFVSSPEQKTATLNPVDNLDASTRYIATIKGGDSGAKDENDRLLQTDETWSFQTRPVSIAIGSVAILVIIVFAVFGVGWLVFVNQPILLTKAVKVQRDLPAFTVIAPTDVTATTTIWPPVRAISKTEDAVGRITKSPLKRGAILTNSRLVKLPKDVPVPQDWQLLSVPYSSTTVSPAAGQEIKLLGVDADEETAEVVSDQAKAIAVAGKQLVVAVPPEEANLAASYLDSNDFDTTSSRNATRSRSIQVVLELPKLKQ